MGCRAQAGGRAHPPADAHARRQAARFAGRPLRHAGAHGARPRARGRGSEIQAHDQRPAPGARAAAKRVDRLVARARRQAGHGALSPAGGRAGHDARDVRSQRPRPTCRPGRCLAGLGGTAFATPAQAGACAQRLSSRGAKFRSRGSIPPTMPPSVKPTDAELEAFYKSNAAHVPGARAGQHRIRRARPRHREEGPHRERAGPQDLLRAKCRAPGWQGGAPGQPHPDHRAQGRTGRRARQGQGQGGGTARGSEEGARQLRRGGQEEFAGPGVRAPTAATSISSPAAQ